MDTAFLQNFVEVIDQGSIAEVARKQGLTPAAINLRIKKVEEELGFKLVIRSGHTVKATPEGAMVLAQAKRVLDEVRNLKGSFAWPRRFRAHHNWCIRFGHVDNDSGSDDTTH